MSGSASPVAAAGREGGDGATELAELRELLHDFGLATTAKDVSVMINIRGPVPGVLQHAVAGEDWARHPARGAGAQTPARRVEQHQRPPGSEPRETVVRETAAVSGPAAAVRLRHNAADNCDLHYGTGGARAGRGMRPGRWLACLCCR